MFTITKEQVTIDKQYSSRKTYELIRDYVDESTIRIVPNTHLKRVQTMLALDSVLQDWEQGDFTDLEYTNYITEKGYLTLVDRIRTL